MYPLMDCYFCTFFTSAVRQSHLFCSLLGGQGEAEWRAGARLHPGAHGVGWDGR